MPLIRGAVPGFVLYVQGAVGDYPLVPPADVVAACIANWQMVPNLVREEFAHSEKAVTKKSKVRQRRINNEIQLSTQSARLLSTLRKQFPKLTVQRFRRVLNSKR